MSTIRERDAEWEPSPIEGGGWRRETRIAEGDVPDLWSGTIADRRALLAAGDALADHAGRYHQRSESGPLAVCADCGDKWPCPTAYNRQRYRVAGARA